VKIHLTPPNYIAAAYAATNGDTLRAADRLRELGVPVELDVDTCSCGAYEHEHQVLLVPGFRAHSSPDGPFPLIHPEPATRSWRRLSEICSLCLAPGGRPRRLFHEVPEEVAAHNLCDRCATTCHLEQPRSIRESVVLLGAKPHSHRLDYDSLPFGTKGDGGRAIREALGIALDDEAGLHIRATVLHIVPRADQRVNATTMAAWGRWLDPVIVGARRVVTLGPSTAAAIGIPLRYDVPHHDRPWSTWRSHVGRHFTALPPPSTTSPLWARATSTFRELLDL